MEPKEYCGCNSAWPDESTLREFDEDILDRIKLSDDTCPGCELYRWTFSNEEDEKAWRQAIMIEELSGKKGFVWKGAWSRGKKMP